MRAALVDGDTVVNVIVAGAGFAPPGGLILVPSEEAGIGWRYDPDTGALTAPEPEPAPEPPMPTLSRRQLRLALLSIGLTAADIEAQIATIADPQGQAAALIEWQDASAYERDHPLLADIASALDLPPEHIDALWRWAAGL